MFEPKTSQQEVFDYMVQFEKQHTESTRIKGIYPTARMIQIVFGISRTRSTWYRKKFEKKVNVILSLRNR